MANRRQPLIPRWLWPGLLAAGLILTIAVLAMGRCGGTRRTAIGVVYGKTATCGT
jgi:hypothetical protein